MNAYATVAFTVTKFLPAAAIKKISRNQSMGSSSDDRRNKQLKQHCGLTGWAGSGWQIK